MIICSPFAGNQFETKILFSAVLNFAAKIDYWLKMDGGPRGSESDDVDDRSPSPASQADDNDGLQGLMLLNFFSPNFMAQ